MITLERVMVIHERDGTHRISLPCRPDTISLPGQRVLSICESCHRAYDRAAERPPVRWTICPFCYIA